MSEPNNQEGFNFPKIFLYFVLLVCVLPIGLNLAGFDFASVSHGLLIEEIDSHFIWDGKKEVHFCRAKG